MLINCVVNVPDRSFVIFLSISLALSEWLLSGYRFLFQISAFFAIILVSTERQQVDIFEEVILEVVDQFWAVHFPKCVITSYLIAEVFIFPELYFQNSTSGNMGLFSQNSTSEKTSSGFFDPIFSELTL